ncbi:hypothetical protein EYF80_021214 [Liparis tanakae]|uniref:Uncharacterized protein n=1 Tax=Liparis tanakae TaxID=230148 RepID=A0A4Z2HS39_9TELE|nr:hypothetical protein EYF80_021214 [Liparis tanakae]
MLSIANSCNAPRAPRGYLRAAATLPPLDSPRFTGSMCTSLRRVAACAECQGKGNLKSTALLEGVSRNLQNCWFVSVCWEICEGRTSGVQSCAVENDCGLLFPLNKHHFTHQCESGPGGRHSVNPSRFLEGRVGLAGVYIINFIFIVKFIRQLAKTKSIPATRGKELLFYFHNPLDGNKQRP